MEETVSHEAMSLLGQLRSGPESVEPYPIYAKLRDLGPLLRMTVGTYLATDAPTCREVLRRPEWTVPTPQWKDVNRPAWRTHPSLIAAGKTLMQHNPPMHTLQRGAIGRYFKPGALDELESVIQEIADRRLAELAEQIAVKRRADYAALVAHLVPMEVLCRLLGLPDDVDALVQASRNYRYAMELWPGRGQLLEADISADAVAAYLTVALGERSRCPATDVLGDLLTFENSERVPSAALDLATTVLVAGWETTAAMLNSMLLGLSRYPEQAAWLRGHPGALPDACAELIRWDPPIQMASRVAARDTVLAGVSIPAGRAVIALIGSAEHDPREVQEPGSLDFTRPARRSLAFGVGMHYCLGAHLAQLEARIMLRALLRRLPNLKVAGPAIRQRGIVFRSLRSLPVELA
ncbi:cytochrome P450 [Streptomyces formicae]|uniref:Cytochrome P450 n=1 Tax=Streptomyces formicae TaxID=1616117 RepID=A0ABY3WWC2_9ACTN|nr:cytochrome P450 [Streptomyces formicae]UNM14781.1 cytochrome P450 [Streptomyces formicae]